MGLLDGKVAVVTGASRGLGRAISIGLRGAGVAVAVSALDVASLGDVPDEVKGLSLMAISSMTGKRPLTGRTPYAAAKMRVIGLCRTLALELGRFGIRVNGVCPGAS
jgi:NAD(P)-dependent dehydrogenase (short-subunit alcohol dehydrogenase family)